ncbi:MAG: cytidylyltransferase domain-containing protein [Clostridia bacterium]
MLTAAIIQARMGSTRLPGKVLKQLQDHTVLGHVIRRIKQVKSINKIVIATTNLPIDDVIEQEANRYGIEVYRGSEQDVLSRYYEAALQVNAETIIRITSDCPLIDPMVTEQVIQYYSKHSYDYVSNSLARTYPRGLDTEVFSMKALQEAHQQANQIHEREHVTPYIYLRSDEFKLGHVLADEDHSSHRWTLDTEEDWQLIQEIYRELYHPDHYFTWLDVLAFLKDRPDLVALNAHVEQKKL